MIQSPSYMRIPGNPTAAPPLIRCPSPSPIHTLRVVRREPASALTRTAGGCGDEFLGCMIGEIRDGVVHVDRIAPADVSPLRSTATEVVPESTCEDAGWTGTVGMIHNHPTGERCWYYFPGTQVPTSDEQSFVRTPYAVDAIMCGAKVVWIGRNMVQEELGLVETGAGNGLEP